MRGFLEQCESVLTLTHSEFLKQEDFSKRYMERRGQECTMKAIINATIFCPVNGLIKNGTVLFNGKIKEIGKNVEIPSGTKTIDAKGKFVVPGFIDAHTHQGLFDGTIGWAGMDGN